MGEIIHLGFSLQEDTIKRYEIASNVRTLTFCCTGCEINTAGIINQRNLNLRLCPICNQVLYDETDPEKRAGNGKDSSESTRPGW